MKRREFITLLGGTAAAWPLAARAQLSTVPVIGFLSSLSHSDLGLVIPGFHQGLPRGSVIAALQNPENPPSVEEGKAAQAAAAALGQPLLIVNASKPGHIDDAFATIKEQQARAVIVSSDPFFFSERVKLVVLMARDGLPMVFADREQAEAGGLISYGASRTDAYRQAGNYVGRIVKGEKPAELPVVLPTKFRSSTSRPRSRCASTFRQPSSPAPTR
jgi:ABC-type uncharacterized transport system substrate-binding protein